jgi:hypothetical protein
MAIINQSPAGQPSVSFPAVNIEASGVDPFRQRRNIVGISSIALTFNGENSVGPPTVPTAGQIWPLGLIPV